MDEAQVGEGSAGDQCDVEVGSGECGEGDPRQCHVATVQCGHLNPEPVPHGMLGEVLQPTAGDVPAGVARQRVGPQHDDVDPQDHVAHAKLETLVANQRVDRIDRVDDRDDHRRVEEVAVCILDDEWETGLTGVASVSIWHGAGGWRGPEGAVVGLAVVVTGEPEAQQERQHHDRQRHERRELGQRLAKDTRALYTRLAQTGRRKWRQIVVAIDVVVLLACRADYGIRNPCGEQHHSDQRWDPPAVSTKRLFIDSGAAWGRGWA